MVGGELHADSPGTMLRGADPAAVLPIIEAIDKLPATSTGAFVFGPSSQPDGTILIERGRVCFAIESRAGKRLTDILRARIGPAASGSALDDIVRRCRAEGTPLGEALVTSGIVSSDGFRDALRQQTSEAMLGLCQREQAPPVWIAHRRQRYDARFTFDAAELMASVGACCRPEFADRSRRELEIMLRPGGRGVAFMWAGASSSVLFPVGEKRGSGFSAQETIALGRWAMHVLEAKLMQQSIPRLAAMLGPKGDSTVAWIAEGLVYVVLCDNPSSLAHVLGKRARASSDGRSGS